MADVERMYIDGEWTLAEGGATFDVVNPADRTVVARVTNGAVPDVQRAVRAAHRAFTDWSVLAPKDRGRFLLGIQELMEERRDELARLVTLENGKPFEEAKKEVQFSLGYFGWFAEEARRMTGEWIPSPQPGKRYWVLRQPVGPVAAVTPWNFPATMVTRKIAPALAAGCTVVLKPASATPLTALAIAKIAEDTGLPRGVFNVLTTNRSGLVGAELLTHPLIRKIGFTGSTDVGKGIMEAAARQIKRLSFELGGNAPFIVFEDADFKAALDGAVAMKFLRVAGQSCICANRIYVQRSIADRFVPAFVDAVKGLKVASGFEPAAQSGPLINEEPRANVHGLVGANDAAGYTHEIPFGGFKESGLGREGGHEGIEEYTEVKSVVVNLG